MRNAKPAKGQALEGVLNVNNICKQLVARMLVNVMAGNSEKVWSLYDMYYKEQRLHAPVREFIQAKEREEGIA